MTVRILTGDCRELLAAMPDASVHCCVTSPPYFGLRDYGHAEQIGLEASPEEYVAKLVEVFREVRRVLRNDGTLWLNLGDSYCSQGGLHDGRDDNQSGVGAGARVWREGAARADGNVRADGASRRNRNGTSAPGLKAKDLIGIPWMVAFALRADGWWLRQDIIWSKPNPMPESVEDRCTKAHEYLFLLSKSKSYYCDMEAIKEPAVNTKMPGRNMTDTAENYGAGNGGNSGLKSLRNKYRDDGLPDDRNKRSVWTVPTRSYKEAHFATFPPDLIEPCILAGCPEGGTVLDPFGGAGTTGLVADRHQRDAVLCELNPEYVGIAERRLRGDSPLFAEVSMEAEAT